MGSLTIPDSGKVYVDTPPVIHSVERIAIYESLLRPLWDAMDAERIGVVTSELTLLETLVKPTKDGNDALAADYETFLTKTRLELHPISLSILKNAAKLRAAVGLKTPDAIHAATAQFIGCSEFITNDSDFRKASGLKVVVLQGPSLN